MEKYVIQCVHTEQAIPFYFDTKKEAEDKMIEKGYQKHDYRIVIVNIGNDVEHK